MHQHDFRGIVATAEHRFAEKATADTDTVESAHQLFILPAFYRMSETEFMEPQVGAAHLWGDPGSAAVQSGPEPAAPINDAGKVLVKTDAVVILVQAAFKRTGNMYFTGIKDRAWIW